MLQTTQGFVLRSVKFGETSLVCTIFTRIFGVESFIVQGVRSAKSRSNKAALFQPATFLDIVVYQKPNVSLQRLRDYQSAYLYTTLQQQAVKNTIALFSVELLLRLLPEHAPIPELFDFAFDYFRTLDVTENGQVSNFPLFFIIQCGRRLGFDIHGYYSDNTPYINISDGSYTALPPSTQPFLDDEEARALSMLLSVKHFSELAAIQLNAAMRYTLLEWYIIFLRMHTQHLGIIKSLPVLKAILH